MSKKLIIFDFFGVISSEVFPIWGKKYFSEDEMKQVRKSIISKADKGIITEREMFKNLSEITGEKSEEILKKWLEIAVLNQDVINLIIELRKQYKIALLSNAPAEFLYRIFERINKTISINKLFDNIVISSKVNMIKPNKEIFEFLLSKINAIPSEAIFIDDNISNVEAAQNIGIHGILFQNVEKLKKELDWI